MSRFNRLKRGNPVGVGFVRTLARRGAAFIAAAVLVGTAFAAPPDLPNPSGKTR
jgi:hypothetical protein